MKSISQVNDVILNTPFRVYGNDEKGYCLILGNNVITEPKPTAQEAIDELKTNMWNIMLNAICVIFTQLQTKQN